MWIVQRHPIGGSNLEIAAVVEGSHGTRSYGWHDGVKKIIILADRHVPNQRPYSKAMFELALKEAQDVCDELNKDQEESIPKILKSERDRIEEAVQGFTQNQGFVLTDEVYMDLLKWVNLLSIETQSWDMGLALIVVKMMSSDELIISRNKPEQDIKALIEVMIHIYRHYLDNKSMFLLLVEALEQQKDMDLDLRLAIIKGNASFDKVMTVLRKNHTFQPFSI